MAGHAQLKFVMTECSKTQIRLAGLNLECIVLHGFIFNVIFPEGYARKRICKGCSAQIENLVNLQSKPINY